jgi:integrase
MEESVMIRKAMRRGETRLVIDIHYRRKDGTRARFRKDAQVQTLAAARAEERRILGLIAQHGEPFEPAAEGAAEEARPLTFAEAVEIFRAGKAVTALKPSTRAAYEEILETRLLPKIADTPLPEITFELVNRLDAELVEAAASASRRRNVMIVLRSVLSAACDAGKLAEMPRLPKLPKVGETVLSVLSAEDVERLLKVASPAARLAFALGAYAGLRAGEVRGLRWSDVSFKTGGGGAGGTAGAGEIIIRQAICKGEVCTPKSGDQRKIPIAPQLLPILEQAANKKESQSAHVAITEQGQVWGEWGLNQALKRAAKRAGLDARWRFHDLRHAFVTGMFRSGTPAPVVQALAGHLELTTTQRYAHAIDGDLHDAVRRFGAPR